MPSKRHVPRAHAPTHIRTLLMRGTATLPDELYDILDAGSDVLLVMEPPDDGFSAYADRVVMWTGRGQLTIDGEPLRWAAHRDYIRLLFPLKR